MTQSVNLRNRCRNYARTERNAKADSNRDSAIAETDGWGALAADGDTIIASKAYVDAMDQTKQDKNDRVTETWANSTADHSSTTKYPSMYTLNSAVGAGTSALDGNNADSETGVSAGAAADNTKVGMPVVKVTETDGIVTATLGTITDKGLAANAVTEAKINNGAVTTDKIADDAVTTGKIANSNVTMGKTNFVVHEVVGDQSNEITDLSWLAATNNENNKAEKALYNANAKPEDFVPTVGAVNGLLLRQGQAVKSWIEDGESGTAEAYNYDRAASYDANDEFVAAGMTDNYVPTVAAVEKRVQKAQADAISQAGTNVLKETNNVLSSGNTTYLPTVAAVQAAKDTTEVATESGGTITITAGTNTDDNHVPTSLTVKNDMDTLKTAINKKLNANTAITAKNNSIVNYDANGLVTGGVVFEDASGGLTGVNGETAGNMRCSTTNPCVLTYLGGTGANAKYRWTAMDTENVTAQ